MEALKIFCMYDRRLDGYLKSPVRRGMEFEKLVSDIFSGIGWDIQQNYRFDGMKHDWNMIEKIQV